MTGLLLACTLAAALQAPAATPAASPAASLAAPASASAPAQGVPSANFYFRVWPDTVVKFNPRTDVVEKVLKNRHGHGYDLEPSHDQKKLFHVTGQQAFIEVIDVKTLERVDELSLEEVGFVVRIDTIKEIPGGERLYVKIDKVQKKLDRFVIEEAEWVEYDMLEHQVVKRMKELPKAIRRAARISPDGTLWHIVDKDITIVDPKTLEETGKIELSKPLYPGLGALRPITDDFYDSLNPKAYRFVYSMRDPVAKNRTLFGLLDIDLEKNTIAKMTEWGAMPPVGNWRLSLDRRFAVGTVRARRGGGGGGGGGDGQSEGRDPEVTFYTLDLSNGKKVRETRVEKLRNGLWLSAISPDASKIYLSGRGREIVVYDDQHQYLKTIDLPGESDGGMIELADRD